MAAWEIKLASVSPGRRGWRWKVGKICSNVPYVIVTKASVVVSRHYTEAGVLKRLAILLASGLNCVALDMRSGIMVKR